MKAQLLPVHLASVMDAELSAQLENLRSLLVDEAQILSPVALDAFLPAADAVLFPSSWAKPSASWDVSGPSTCPSLR